MALSPKPYKRNIKNYLLLPKFQVKFISYFIGMFLLSAISLYSVSYLFFWRLKEKAMSVGIPQGHIFYRFIDGQKADLDWLFFLLVIINFIILVGAGIIISHRVAGPFYKIKQYLSSPNMKEQHFQLGEKDFFKEIEPVMNNLKERMK